jgi:DNA-binding response OmpR family regulator
MEEYLMRILIIEDDKDLCEIISKQLNRNGFSTDICNNGGDALFYAMKQTYEIIILDRMLPEKDGLTIINEIRSKNITTPVIMVTAMDTLQNRIEGLDSGADDYLVKPFELEELLARIRALVRRPTTIMNSELLSFSDINLNVNEKILASYTASCVLSKRETDLFAFFIKNKEQTILRETLLSRIWGADFFVMDSNLDNFICFLRKRLHTVNSHVTIKTIRAVGYRLEE